MNIRKILAWTMLLMIIVVTPGFASVKGKLINKSVKDISSVILLGGIPHPHRVGLDPKRDGLKIEKLLGLLGGSTRYNEIKGREYSATGGYFQSMEMMLRDGSHIIISPALSEKRFTNGRTISAYKDRILITLKIKNKYANYVLFSKELVKYMNFLEANDFPSVGFVLYNPRQFKADDAIEISGIGCREKQVDIFITNKSFGGTEEYKIAVAKPTNGTWMWKGMLSKDIKTFDGKPINFKGDKYVINVHIGDITFVSKQILNFKDKVVNGM